ncbi:MAG: UDP-N-acetylmuramoyl-tripeptide--D-alanyl-D-alanine ligase [Acidobacteria bacterium]|nr:UDP-N-acetylmuramoyl-tripeptide--D-alanyl-D-alanine ligase [Acidobacteriota bacterium]
MKLETAAQYMNADASSLSPALLEAEVISFQTDSREVKAGDLFFAFSPPEFGDNGFNGDFRDAHEFIPTAFENGARACVARKDRFIVHQELLKPFENKLIFAEDAIAALQTLAHKVYLDWNKPVVAITGSAGKTTAKELTAHVLETPSRKVLRNLKNLNNGLGLPLTVLRLVADDSYDVAILEMGMSTPRREIARLCKITPPDVGVELNVLPVHVEHLGSIENVAKAKAELIEGLKPDGTAILNADDFRVIEMRKIHPGRVITYGIDNTADVMAVGVDMKRFGETHFTLKTPDGEEQVVFQLSGKHNVLNALAASAVGYSFGMTAAEISRALNTVKPPSQRGEVLNFKKGFTVINDSYNSNPAALLGMVKTLNDGAQNASRRIVVAGEMLELGSEQKEIHEDTGRKLAASGIDYLIGVRGLARHMVDSARESGLSESMFFDSSEEAGEFLSGEIGENDIVLVKGSRGVRTENVIDKLVRKYELESRD